MKKAALHNLGCKVNAYETEAMTQLLERAGYNIVQFNEQSDVYIINTCSVTNMADKKSRQMLHRAKKMNPDAIVVATGCYVQTATEKVMDDLSIDIVIGNNKKKEIVSILEEYFERQDKNKSQVIDINNTSEYEDLEIATVTEHTRAHIKIQDGCNNFCSYCIIPYARGRIRSRKIQNIKKEIIRLAQQGFKEVVFTGINLGSYCDGDCQLIDVIEMANKIDGVERIRLGSLDPEVISESFVKRLSIVSKICPHFHLSLQSGCDKTLKAMNRHYTSGEYYEKCCMLRKYFENPAFTTDVIVGFPGETDKDYDESREFLKKVGFAELHVFKYSKRSGTVAASMPEQVSENIKNLRSDELIKIGNILTKDYRKSKLGAKASVLFEEETEIKGKKYWMGYTKDYIKTAIEDNGNLGGEIMEVKLVDLISDEIMLATK